MRPLEWLRNLGRKKPTKLELAEKARQEMLREFDGHMNQLKERHPNLPLIIKREEKEVSLRTKLPYGGTDNVVTVAIHPTVISGGRMFVPETSTTPPRENFKIVLYEGPTNFEHAHHASEIGQAKEKLAKIVEKHDKDHQA